MEENLFGDPYETPQRQPSTEEIKKKRRWENGFQKWSDKEAGDGYTPYGACGYGAICNFCTDNHYGRPCVRALNEMLRTKRKRIDYDATTFEKAFDGEV